MPLKYELDHVIGSSITGRLSQNTAACVKCDVDDNYTCNVLMFPVFLGTNVSEIGPSDETSLTPAKNSREVTDTMFMSTPCTSSTFLDNSTRNLRWFVKDDLASLSVEKYGQNGVSDICTTVELVIPDTEMSSSYGMMALIVITGWAFYACNSLSSGICGVNVRYVGKSGFSSCKWLKSITFTRELSTTGIYCFSLCTSLNDFRYCWTVPPLVYSGTDPFEKASALTTVRMQIGCTLSFFLPKQAQPRMDVRYSLVVCEHKSS